MQIYGAEDWTRFAGVANEPNRVLELEMPAKAGTA
jgi:hypothetical protein